MEPLHTIAAFDPAAASYDYLSLAMTLMKWALIGAVICTPLAMWLQRDR